MALTRHAQLAARALGVPANGLTVEPIAAGQGLTVARVSLADGRSWVLKEVAPQQRGEIVLLAWLSREGSAWVPRVVACDPDPSGGYPWVLMEDLGHVRLRDVPTALNYVRAAEALADLQRHVGLHWMELEGLGVPHRRSEDWEAVGLGIVELMEHPDSPVAPKDRPALAASAWNSGDAAHDTRLLPTGLVHGDLHAANVAVIDDRVCFLDWGVAYLGASLLGLEELMVSAGRRLRSHSDVGQVRAAYLRRWATDLGKPGYLSRPLAACRLLVRLQLVLESLRESVHEGTDDAARLYGRISGAVAANREWSDLVRAG